MKKKGMVCSYYCQQNAIRFRIRRAQPQGHKRFKTDIGVTEPSVSPYPSPIVLVSTNDGSLPSSES